MAKLIYLFNLYYSYYIIASSFFGKNILFPFANIFALSFIQKALCVSRFCLCISVHQPPCGHVWITKADVWEFTSDKQIRLHVANTEVLGFDHKGELMIQRSCQPQHGVLGMCSPTASVLKLEYRIKGYHFNHRAPNQRKLLVRDLIR